MNNTLQVLVNSGRAIGIDISVYNDKLDIAQAKVIPDYVIMRAGLGLQSGGIVKDLRFDNHYAELKKHPEILRGMYWYMSCHSPWKNQFNFYKNIIDNIDIDFICVDFESLFNINTLGYFAYATIDMLSALEDEYPTKRVILYSRKGIYEDWLRHYTSQVDSFPYWHAQYGFINWIDANQTKLIEWLNNITLGIMHPNIPSSRGDNWQIWQIGDRTGLASDFGLTGSNVDVNITRLSKNDFINWIGKPARWDEEPPEDEEEDDPEIVIEKIDGDLHIHIYTYKDKEND